MGQCTSAEQGDYVIVDPYDGDKFLGYRHGEGTYHYSNGDIYKGNGNGIKDTAMELTRVWAEKCKWYFLCGSFNSIVSHPSLRISTICKCFGICLLF